ncbi:hypothetical protein F5Y17DRAFT_433759 [Xylariaceae sp. FL0594]|nr:hypothetical protein F5Y17DRAFT_433759 [Xylariaceae sp. FL0594]
MHLSSSCPPETPSTAMSTGMNLLSLPPEILLQICRQVGDCHDYKTLYRLAQVNRSIAGIAIQELYRGLDDIFGLQHYPLRNVCYWRSLVLSSLGATLYPYCTYLRLLHLTGLLECIDEMPRDAELRGIFFDRPMKVLLGCEDAVRAIKDETWRDQLLFQCANSIVKYIRNFADTNGSSVSLTHLEAPFIPRELFLAWVRYLPNLESLRLQDGSILDAEVAKAVSESCPRFSDLKCSHFPSGTAAFLKALPPHTLRGFVCEPITRRALWRLGDHRQSRPGAATLKALTNHSSSLRMLDLRFLEPSVAENLGLLSSCTRLRDICIEGTFRDEPDFSQDSNLFSETVLAQVTRWISSCKELRELRLVQVPEALSILTAVLHQPEIGLTHLVICDYRSATVEVMKATWKALGKQTKLHDLTITLQDSGRPPQELPAELISSICQLTSLKNLNLIEFAVTSSETICRFAQSLPGLNVFWFGGSMDIYHDSVLECLGRMHRLISLSIYGTGCYTYEALLKFTQSLDPVGNSGMEVQIPYLMPWDRSILDLADLEQAHKDQWRPGLPDPSQVEKLRKDFASRLGGHLNVNIRGYWL